MKSAVIWRAHLARIFGLALMLAGLAPIIWLALNSVHSMPIEPWAPLHRLPTLAYSSLLALVVSLPGLGVMWLGATLAARQKDVLEASKRAKQDRLRRMRQYVRDERVEPFIGSPMTIDVDKEPS
jgi:hypothetical protein